MNEKTKYEILKLREAMKGYHGADVNAEETDQEQKLPFPAPVKGGKGTKRVPLPLDFEKIVGGANLFALLQGRSSCRSYREEDLSLRELSFLLWATQGIRYFAGREKQVAFRNVPSAGSRHPLETYLFVSRVEGIRPGVYHYLPAGHELEIWEELPEYKEILTEALCGQRFAAEAPVTFVWSAVPYRTEWRYGLKAHKYIMLDAGHVCENLYLACEAIGCGACAIGAYDQDLMDELLGFAPGPSSGKEYEFTLYAAPVGRKQQSK